VRPRCDHLHMRKSEARTAAEILRAILARSYNTTQRYIDLAGERFREEADRLERRLWGDSGTKMRYQVDAQPSAQEDAEALEPLG
jgi:hypothetical protein